MNEHKELMSKGTSKGSFFNTRTNTFLKILYVIFICSLLSILIFIVYITGSKREKAVQINNNEHDKQLFIKESEVEIQKRKQILEEARQLTAIIEKEQLEKQKIQKEKEQRRKSLQQKAELLAKQQEVQQKIQQDQLDLQKAARQDAWDEMERHRVEQRKLKEAEEKQIQWKKSIKDFGQGLTNYSELGVGQIGTISGIIKTVQVIDEENFLADIPLHTKPKGVTSGRKAKMAVEGSKEYYEAFFSKQSMPTNSATEHVLVWFKGIGTSNLVDDQEIQMSYVFNVTGTKMYTTVSGGSRTVFMLEIVDPPEF